MKGPDIKFSDYEFPTTVPGGVYSDLMNVNIIDDIFTSYQDNDTVWVGTINWTYALNFTGKFLVGLNWTVMPKLKF